MDDPANGTYSRAPELEDLVRICRALNDEQAQYILIGGFSVILHGAVRTTKDIDLLVEASPGNIAKVKKALAILADNAAAQIADDEVEKYQVIRVGDEVVVDLMASACGLRYADAAPHVEIRSIEGVDIPIANKEILIRMKATIRPSDQMDVNFLQQLIREEQKK